MQLAKESTDAHRDVDQKNPMPGVVIGEITADDRPQDRSNDGGNGGDGKCLLALVWGKGVENDGLLSRLEPAAEKTLQSTEDEQLGEVGGDAAQKRGDGKACDTEQKIALSPHAHAEVAGDCEHDAVGNEIGREGPGAFIVTDGHGAGDVR